MKALNWLLNRTFRWESRGGEGREVFSTAWCTMPFAAVLIPIIPDFKRSSSRVKNTYRLWREFSDKSQGKTAIYWFRFDDLSNEIEFDEVCVGLSWNLRDFVLVLVRKRFQIDGKWSVVCNGFLLLGKWFDFNWFLYMIDYGIWNRSLKMTELWKMKKISRF